MPDCIFCKIIRQEIPCYKVYEDELCLAFLDLSQATPGHTLIIPKEHSQNFLETDIKTIAHMMEKAQCIAQRLMKNLHASGMNILTNVNESAGQTVMHFHIHLIPRYEDDDVEIHFKDHQQETNFDQLLTEIRK